MKLCAPTNEYLKIELCNEHVFMIRQSCDVNTGSDATMSCMFFNHIRINYVDGIYLQAPKFQKSAHVCACTRAFPLTHDVETQNTCPETCE